MTKTKLQEIALFVTRFVFGLLFLESGLSKLLGDFSAAGFLNNASGPFASLFASMAGSNLVNFLVIFGEIGIGVALIFGVLMWLATLGGITMMTLYYLALFPPETGYINANIIYILVFLLLAFFHAEEHWGLEQRWKQLLPDSDTNSQTRTRPTTRIYPEE